MAFSVKPEAALASCFRNILQDMHPIYNSNDLLSFWGIHRDLKTLEKRLKKIQDVLNDAERRSQTEEGVSDWMNDLRELIYCIEDFVDDMNIERVRIEKQLAAKNQAAYTAQNQLAALNQAASLYTLWDIMEDCTSQKNTISKRIKEIIDNLENIAKEAKDLDLNPQTLAGTPVASFAVKDGDENGQFVVESEIYGRQEDKDHVIELLMNHNDSSRNYSVVSIVGMGGVGKTTLVRLVVMDERVENHFDMQSWACVSDDFDFKRVVRELIEYISGEKTSKMTTAALLKSLIGMVTAKRVLFVLDDMWTVEAWEKLKVAFTHCAEGSKILVTTRDKIIGHAINDKEIYELQTLEDNYCWDLFKVKAFAGVVDERLERIGRKIVEKCKGVPLAIKVIGSFCLTREEMWESILNNEIWESMEVKDGIFPVLKLSYNYLSSSMKRCFQYFAVFPADYSFKRDDLVRLWIAEGLIECREGGMLEDIGCYYYNEFQRRCIIQEDGRMHDLLHSLACLVSGKFFSSSDKGSKSYTDMRSIRHLSLIDNEVNIQLFDQATCLRTLLVLEEDFLDVINLKWTLLRVLDLRKNNLLELTSSVGNLKHLRYLNLSGCVKLRSIPDSIWELHNLQTLDLSGCWGLGVSRALQTHMGNFQNLRFLSFNDMLTLSDLPSSIVKLSKLLTLDLNYCDNLDRLPNNIGGLQSLQRLWLNGCRSISHLPSDIGNLQHLRELRLSRSSISRLPESICNIRNLQVLDISGCDHLNSLPRNIGNLTSIQKLGRFVVGREEGHGIELLKDMNKLQGELTISYLKNVDSVEHALMANLKEKVLDEIHFDWGRKKCLISINDLQDDDTSGDGRDLDDSINDLEDDDISDAVDRDFDDILSVVGDDDTSDAVDRDFDDILSAVGDDDTSDAVDRDFDDILSAVDRDFDDILSAVGDDDTSDSVDRDFDDILSAVGDDDTSDKTDDDISDAVDRDLEENVLDALEPHPTSLKSLSFLNYRGGRIPKWLSALSFPILKELVMEGLDGTNRMVDLALPSLKRLKIDSCLKLKDVSMGVPKLTRLVVFACQDLTTLSISPSLGTSSSSLASSILDLPQLGHLTFKRCSSLRDIRMVLVPRLRELRIKDCKELKMIYVDHMPNLERLMLRSLPNLTLLRGLHTGSSSSLTSLKELSISLGCEHELISLAMPFDCEAHGSGGMLKELSISSGCVHELISLAMPFDCEAHGSDDLLPPVAGSMLKFSPEGLRYFSSLESFTFLGDKLEAQKLEFLPPPFETEKITGIEGQVLPLVGDDEAGSSSSSLPLTMKKLKIRNYPNLTLLPKALHTIASLRELEISICPELVSFPETGLPPLLQVFRVYSCKNLQYFPTGLNDHTSLRNIYLIDCEQVDVRPDDGPSPNFDCLEVWNCPKLEQQIKQHRKDWLPKTRFNRGYPIF